MSTPGASTVGVAPDMVMPIKVRDLGVEVRGSIERPHAASELNERQGWVAVSRDTMVTFWRVSFVFDILFFKLLVNLSRFDCECFVNLLRFFIAGRWRQRWKDDRAINDVYERLRKDEHWIRHILESSARKWQLGPVTMLQGWLEN